MIEHMVYPENGATPFCKDCGYLVNCRCSWCPRCGQLTGNNTQGHYWSYCNVTKTTRDFHMCCPDCCELEGVEPTAPFHPRYVELLEQQEATMDEMAQSQDRARKFLNDISIDYEETYPDMIASLRKHYGLT